MQREIPLAANTSEQDISGNELLVNVYPRATTGGKYPFNLINTPGLAFFCELPTFPVLGLHENGEKAFAVTPTRMYEIFKDGSYSELGVVDLSGRVSIEDNGRQIVVVDGKKGFYWDGKTNEVLQITSNAFYPASSVTYQDGYFIFNRAGTGQFFISELLDVAFDPLDFATAEGQPDPLVYVLSDHREVFMFGTETIEVWYNSGASDFPFERNQGAFIEKGCGARHTIAKQNNTVYFVGSDLMVYQMTGYTPVRISNHAVEKTLKGVDLEDAFAYTYQDEGHLFYVLTIPGRDLTWCYDISTGAWHIRQSYHFGRHQSNNAIFFDSKTLVGDFQNGRIYQMASAWYTDDGQPVVREFVLPTVNNGREFLSVDSFELDMASGIGLIQGQGQDPKARLEFSKDGGKTWSNCKFADIGKIGEYLTRVKWNRLGAARQFTFRVRISDPVPIDIGGAYIEIR
ncbi:stabilization protein [Vibrio phage 1.211.B._10N.222.52.F11]|nr:stabilization protein [Vibrio phage 1.211.A._10N.222.52.F11]AUR95745.1 stabilization protein [Vibrio phage 1.211.B._10N.222.52.F11]